jgi:hypothetical protein
MKYAALLALLFANSAFANGLDDLRGALGALQGQGTLRGTFEAHQQAAEVDGKDSTPDAASAQAQVEEDASGLQVRWDRAVLKRANEQAWAAKGGKKGQALSTLIGSTSALRLAGAVNYAPALLHALEGAQLKAERSDSWQGKSARLLELSLVEAAPAEEKVKMKESTHEARIWLGADGAPLAATVTHRRKASVMVFLSFEQEAREEFVFSVVANRLVVLKRDEQGTAKGLGSTTQYRNGYTFTPKV